MDIAEQFDNVKAGEKKDTLAKLLRHWYQEGNSSSFKLGHHLVQFNIKDVAPITGMCNEGILVPVEKKEGNMQVVHETLESRYKG